MLIDRGHQLKQTLGHCSWARKTMNKLSVDRNCSRQALKISKLVMLELFTAGSPWLGAEYTFLAYIALISLLVFTSQTIEISPERQLTEYIQLINAPAFDPAKLTLQKAYKTGTYNRLRPLFARIFCTPATSAPVERIFSQSGLIMRPHRANMSVTLLETLMFLKCKKQ